MTGMLTRLPRAAWLTVAGLLVVAAVVALRPGAETRTVSADFSRAVQVFVGSEVRILGVPVGEVTAVVPQGSTVRVEMEYDAEYAVPADAQAVIVTPTLTADRFVQLTPAYAGDGPVLEDGAEIDVESTGTPVELDRIYRSLSDLTQALGPNGVNRNGTLNNTLKAGARFLDGQGRQANATIKDTAALVQTLGDASDELFGTVRALDGFAATLAANDRVVGRFLRDLGDVSQQLAGEKDELAAALANLAAVLAKVESFVRDNRELLVADVEDLSTVLKAIASQKKALEAILDIGPTAMGNLAIAFDPASQSIGSRIDVQGNVADLDGLLCALARQGDIPDAALACDVFEALLEPIFGRPSQGGGGGQPQVRYGSEHSAGDLGELLGGRA